MWSRCPRTSAREGGFTLIEVVVVTALLLVVVGAMLSIFNGVQRTAARQVSRSETADEVRLAMDRMTKEIRQATAIEPTSTTAILDMTTFVDGTLTNVVYDASGGDTLTRTVGGNTVVILSRLQDTAVFQYSPDVADASVVTITLVAKPQKFSQDVSDVTLTSEVQLRNR